MPEIETEAEKTRDEIATILRDVADQLEAGGDLTLELGHQSVTVTPEAPITLKMEGEWAEGGGAQKESVELELVWHRSAEPSTESSEPEPQEQ